MKRLLTLSLLAGLFWPAIACDQAPPTNPMQPEVLAPEPVVFAMEAGADCTVQCTPMPPNNPQGHTRCFLTGQCRDVSAAVDRNGNGVVCGATPEGPYIDDVAPQTPFLRMRPEVVTPCPSPAYPWRVEVAGG